jgi:hypothetical protein
MRWCCFKYALPLYNLEEIAMKYFEVQNSPELKYAPKLKDWYGKFDVRDICLDGFPKLPKIQQFIIEPSENTMFTDIILFPFLLVSPVVQEVIKMYRERCFFCNVILVDQLKKESRMYYLPVLDETRSIQLQERKYRNGVYITEPEKAEGEKLKLDRNLFWVRGSKKRHIILSMDMAESLIRRGITGLGLCEVELYSKD